MMALCAWQSKYAACICGLLMNLFSSTVCFYSTDVMCVRDKSQIISANGMHGNEFRVVFFGLTRNQKVLFFGRTTSHLLNEHCAFNLEFTL